MRANCIRGPVMLKWIEQLLGRITRLAYSGWRNFGRGTMPSASD